MSLGSKPILRFYFSGFGLVLLVNIRPTPLLERVPADTPKLIRADRPKVSEETPEANNFGSRLWI